MRSVRRRTTGLATAAALLVPLLPTVGAAAAATPPSSPTTPGAVCTPVLAAPDLQAAFAAASDAYGVPVEILQAASWMQSRWDQRAGLPSIDGGYGLFNLTDTAPDAVDGKGTGEGARAAAGTLSELARAAELAGLDAERLKTDARANLCGGAALLAAAPHGVGLSGWRSAVATLHDSADFPDQVYATVAQGAQRTTAEGEAVTLAAQPALSALSAPAAAGVSDPETDCPTDLGCEWLPAPYAKDSPSLPDGTGSYGNHDQADRTGAGGPSIDYIVIHSTEGHYQPSVNLVLDPTYLAWSYTIRSSDGHVAQHLEPDDVGWHAGNWYVNMHSIGIEHEGFAGTAAWFTETMYQSSAALVRHLAQEHDVPLDRAHVIGHDQIPGVLAGATRSVHWDPGPYWDWDHYFELLGAPVGGDLAATTDVRPGDVVEVRAGYEENANTVTGCQQGSPGSGECVAGAGTNFVLAHQQPSPDAPYAQDPGWKPSGAAGSTYVSDISARVTSGHKLVVDRVQGEWLGVWWAGSLVWIHNPADRPVVVPSTGTTVTVAGDAPAPLYGRAYPEASAYAAYPGVPVQPVGALEYTVGTEQRYVVADETVATDYYRAVSFDGSAPGDRSDVRGEDTYYQLWYAHKQVYVRAADVERHDPVVGRVAGPAVAGTAKVGWSLTAEPGQYLPGEGATAALQWLRDGEPVPGATGTSYHLTGRDLGHEVALRVTVTADGYAPATWTTAGEAVRAAP